MARHRGWGTDNPDHAGIDAIVATLNQNLSPQSQVDTYLSLCSLWRKGSTWESHSTTATRWKELDESYLNADTLDSLDAAIYKCIEKDARQREDNIPVLTEGEAVEEIAARPKAKPGACVSQRLRSLKNSEWSLRPHQFIRDLSIGALTVGFLIALRFFPTRLRDEDGEPPPWHVVVDHLAAAAKARRQDESKVRGVSTTRAYQPMDIEAVKTHLMSHGYKLHDPPTKGALSSSVPNSPGKRDHEVFDPAAGLPPDRRTMDLPLVAQSNPQGSMQSPFPCKRQKLRTSSASDSGSNAEGEGSVERDIELGRSHNKSLPDDYGNFNDSVSSLEDDFPVYNSDDANESAFQLPSPHTTIDDSQRHSYSMLSGVDDPEPKQSSNTIFSPTSLNGFHEISSIPRLKDHAEEATLHHDQVRSKIQTTSRDSTPPQPTPWFSHPALPDHAVKPALPIPPSPKRPSRSHSATNASPASYTYAYALESLAPEAWLAGDVITKILELLNPDPESILIIESTLLQTADVKRHGPYKLRSLQPTHTHVIAPLNISAAHWTICIVSILKRSVLVYDPLHSRWYRNAAWNAVQRFLQDLDPIFEQFSRSGCATTVGRKWTLEAESTVPLTQRNDYDCGVYCIVAVLDRWANVAPRHRIIAPLWRQAFSTIIRMVEAASERDCQSGEGAILPSKDSNLSNAASSNGSDHTRGIIWWRKPGNTTSQLTSATTTRKQLESALLTATQREIDEAKLDREHALESEREVGEIRALLQRTLDVWDHDVRQAEAALEAMCKRTRRAYNKLAEVPSLGVIRRSVYEIGETGSTYHELVTAATSKLTTCIEDARAFHLSCLDILP